MTHTEESLMALALSIQEGNGGISALRLAIREVLAERNTAIANMQIATVERRLERERAEKAEAECDRLSKDAERYRWLRDGCDNKGTPASWIAHNHYGKDWDAAIDAAMKEQP